MKTLIILSHPDIEGSASQTYLKESLKGIENVTIHHLEANYPDGKIDCKKEQQLLRDHDRILFQFPFYWYSSPALIKRWQEEVLTETFAYTTKGTALHGKEFGLVLSIGNSEKEYQAGGREGFSISELTTPFQAMARKVGMIYKKPFLIYQFQYMTEVEKMRLLIRYQQYTTMEFSDSLREKEKWLIDTIKRTDLTTLPENGKEILEQIIEQMEQYRMDIEELTQYLEE